MVVAVECLDVCVVVGGVPQLDGEVGGACRLMNERWNGRHETYP